MITLVEPEYNLADWFLDNFVESEYKDWIVVKRSSENTKTVTIQVTIYGDVYEFEYEVKEGETKIPFFDGDELSDYTFDNPYEWEIEEIEGTKYWTELEFAPVGLDWEGKIDPVVVLDRFFPNKPPYARLIRVEEVE